MAARDRSRYESGFIVGEAGVCPTMVRTCWRDGPGGYGHSVLQSDFFRATAVTGFPKKDRVTSVVNPQAFDIWWWVLVKIHM